MITNDDKIYTVQDLQREARDGFFPFKSRVTIEKLSKNGILPSHRIQDKKYGKWFFIGREIYAWLKK